jgi:hypothetical protein
VSWRSRSSLRSSPRTRTSGRGLSVSQTSPLRSSTPTSFLSTDGDRKLEFHGLDTRFANRFSSFADSRFPVRTLPYDRGAFYDVSRSFPDEI